MKSGVETKQFSFEPFDLWPSGSFKVGEVKELIDLMIEHYDILCPPELVCMTQEELIPNWTQAYYDWENSNVAVQAGGHLVNRPGYKEFQKRFSKKGLPLVKGQMIGPATLIWALEKKRGPLDPNNIIEFIVEAFEFQFNQLMEVGKQVIICLDEPCAFLRNDTLWLWEETLDILRFRQYHDAGIGLHCCGVPHHSWLKFNWNIVHFDMIELSSAMRNDFDVWLNEFKTYFSSGGWLAAGIFSSSLLKNNFKEDILLSQWVIELMDLLKHLSTRQILISTSCGSGSLTLEELKKEMGHLNEIQQELQKRFL